VTTRTVLLFARYAELLGAESVDVTLEDGATVADLVAALRALPGGASLPAIPLVAVAHAKADFDTVLPRDAELALLPPLAGG
jgi:molybdopterin converting factor small subunit